MTWIEPPALWVGRAGDGLDWRSVLDAGVRAVVQTAAEEPPAPPPRELIVCRFPLLDGGGNDPAVLWLAVRTVAELIRRHVPLLVSCGAGMSRSPAVAAAGPAVARGWTPAEGLAAVTRHRRVDLSPTLWKEICGVVAGQEAG
ncbi:MAG: Dual specificity protein phosphatase [Gemmataceae bacterium]|nr:Dual specificity protein phosphatase [Gemmataceae bacterium]